MSNVQFKCLSCGTRLVVSLLPSRTTLCCIFCGGVDFQSFSEDLLKFQPILAGNEPGDISIISNKEIFSGQGPFGRIWIIDIATKDDKPSVKTDEDQSLQDIANAVLGNTGDKGKGKKNGKNIMR